MCEYIALRLDRGQDLRKEIIQLVKEQNIQAGFIASAVGCLQKLNIRLAEVNGANPRFQRLENFEIVSLTGTLSQQGQHIHISVADSNEQTFGEHLLDGNQVYYYVELIIAKIKKAKYTRIWNGQPLDSEDEGTFHVLHQNTE